MRRTTAGSNAYNCRSSSFVFSANRTRQFENSWKRARAIIALLSRCSEHYHHCLSHSLPHIIPPPPTMPFPITLVNVHVDWWDPRTCLEWPFHVVCFRVEILHLPFLLLSLSSYYLLSFFLSLVPNLYSFLVLFLLTHLCYFFFCVYFSPFLCVSSFCSHHFSCGWLQLKWTGWKFVRDVWSPAWPVAFTRLGSPC